MLVIWFHLNLVSADSILTPTHVISSHCMRGRGQRRADVDHVKTEVFLGDITIIRMGLFSAGIMIVVDWVPLTIGKSGDEHWLIDFVTFLLSGHIGLRTNLLKGGVMSRRCTGATRRLRCRDPLLHHLSLSCDLLSVYSYVCYCAFPFPLLLPSLALFSCYDGW